MALPNDPKNPKDAELFHRMVDDHHPERNDPAKLKRQNEREARAILRSVRNGARKK